MSIEYNTFIMALLTFDELWEKLRNSDESVELEVKTAEEIGKSIAETISAFSNEPMRGGGYILCGIALDRAALFQNYNIVGVPNPDKIQSDLASMCRNMFNSPVRPQLWLEHREGKAVVVAYIPEVQPHEKPIYIKSAGVPKGAFRRIGAADQHCTDEDIALFYQYRDHKTFDETVITDSSLEDLDPQAIAEYRRTRSEINPNAAELSYGDEDLLYALTATSKFEGRTCATIAGLVLFGKQASLRRHFPMNRVDYILVEGREWVPHPEERFKAVEMREALMTLIPRVMAQIIGDMPMVFSLGDNGIHRREVPLIPRTVIREAVVNALMHRSYRVRQPVQIIRYSNRIEIRNPGHSLKSDDRLGEPGSVTRNEKIAAVIHEAALAETKGSGIRAMRAAMVDANLTVPLFESDRENDTFSATLLLHHLLEQNDIEWLAGFKDCNLSDDEARVLIVVREVGAMNNYDYRTLTGLDTLSASRRLQHLRNVKLLEQKGKGNATYYVPGERFKASLEQALGSEARRSQIENLLSEESNPPDKPLPGESNPPDKPLPGESNPPDKPLPGEYDLLDRSLSDRLRLLPDGFPPLPESLKPQLDTMGRRAMPSDVRDAVLALCSWRDLQAFEIATLLGRSMRYIQETYLSPMARDGELAYTHPENQAHPQQGYRITDKGRQMLSQASQSSQQTDRQFGFYTAN